MGKKHSIIILLSLGTVLFIGCSQQPCRGIVQKKPMLKKSEVFQLGTKKDYSLEREWVYKYDGSQQCDMGKPLSPKQMKEQLDGIVVYDQLSKSDGLMHIMVCGSPNGQANLYWIDKGSIDEAKKRGFSVWNFGKVR